MKKCLLAASFVAMVCFGHVANAAFSYSASVTGGALASANYVNFDELIPPLGITGEWSGTAINNVWTSPIGSIGVATVRDAGVVNGGVSGQYAPPFLTGSNGVYFGNPDQPTGSDATTYLTAGGISGSSVTLTFSGPQVYFGVLWGSVDDYNKLSFYRDGTLVGELTGSDVIALPNGYQFAGGTVYVNVQADDDYAFDTVVATSSTSHAFEFDNVAYASSSNSSGGVVPEPASMIVWSLLGTSICGACWTRRKRTA